ncbi:hypothetical protein [Clostridium botulinum]|uniref:hypothetical protein n=1 Tax=Clostridium botulinum TaxID=1491 RepID=UPI003DA67BC6
MCNQDLFEFSDFDGCCDGRIICEEEGERDRDRECERRCRRECERRCRRECERRCRRRCRRREERITLFCIF